MTTAPNPAERTFGLGEVILAHRTYLGLSQRGMAIRLGFDRRDYQRLENGSNRCPVGLLTRIGELVDKFDADVDQLLDAVLAEPGGAVLSVSDDHELEWERQVAARACVIAPTLDPAPRISLTLVGKQKEAS